MSNMKLLSMSLTLIVATLIIPSSAEMEQPTRKFQHLLAARAAGRQAAGVPEIEAKSDEEEKTLAIAEVEIRDGRAQASSSHPAPWTADKAFILGHANAWINAGTGHAIFPAMVWYEFHVENTFAPGRISFRPRKDCCLDQGPTVWQFIGSNDENCGRYGNWTVLCEDQSNAGYSSHYWTKYCDVDEKIFKKFRCLGISVLNTPNPTGIASLKDVRMWKKKYE